MLTTESSFCFHLQKHELSPSYTLYRAFLKTFCCCPPRQFFETYERPFVFLGPSNPQSQSTPRRSSATVSSQADTPGAQAPRDDSRTLSRDTDRVSAMAGGVPPVNIPLRSPNQSGAGVSTSADQPSVEPTSSSSYALTDNGKSDSAEFISASNSRVHSLDADDDFTNSAPSIVRQTFVDNQAVERSPHEPDIGGDDGPTTAAALPSDSIGSVDSDEDVLSSLFADQGVVGENGGAECENARGSDDMYAAKSDVNAKPNYPPTTQDATSEGGQVSESNGSGGVYDEGNEALKTESQGDANAKRDKSPDSVGAAPDAPTLESNGRGGVDEKGDEALEVESPRESSGIISPNAEADDSHNDFRKIDAPKPKEAGTSPLERESRGNDAHDFGPAACSKDENPDSEREPLVGMSADFDAVPENTQNEIVGHEDADQAAGGVDQANEFVVNKEQDALPDAAIDETLESRDTRRVDRPADIDDDATESILAEPSHDRRTDGDVVARDIYSSVTDGDADSSETEEKQSNEVGGGSPTIERCASSSDTQSRRPRDISESSPGINEEHDHRDANISDNPTLDAAECEPRTDDAVANLPNVSSATLEEEADAAAPDEQRLESNHVVADDAQSRNSFETIESVVGSPSNVSFAASENDKVAADEVQVDRPDDRRASRPGGDRDEPVAAADVCENSEAIEDTLGDLVTVGDGDTSGAAVGADDDSENSVATGASQAAVEDTLGDLLKHCLDTIHAIHVDRDRAIADMEGASWLERVCAFCTQHTLLLLLLLLKRQLFVCSTQSFGL